MSRLQLSLNVSNLEAAVAFYTRLLGMPPPSYAPDTPTSPSPSPRSSSSSTHPATAPPGPSTTWAWEVATTGEVTRAEVRLAAQGLPVEPQPGAVCCYARQHKIWARDPDGLAWEYYTVMEHIETP